MALAGGAIRLSVVPVGAGLARVGGRLGGELSAGGVSAGAGRLWSEGFGPPCRVLLLPLLPLETPQDVLKGCC